MDIYYVGFQRLVRQELSRHVVLPRRPQGWSLLSRSGWRVVLSGSSEWPTVWRLLRQSTTPTEEQITDRSLLIDVTHGRIGQKLQCPVDLGRWEKEKNPYPIELFRCHVNTWLQARLLCVTDTVERKENESNKVLLQLYKKRQYAVAARKHTWKENKVVHIVYATSGRECRKKEIGPSGQIL